MAIRRWAFCNGPWWRRPLDKNYAATVQNAAPFLFNDDSKNPYMQQWNLSLQKSIANSDAIELVYMGSGNHNLQSRYDVNQCRPTPDLRCDNSTHGSPYEFIVSHEFVIRYSAISTGSI